MDLLTSRSTPQYRQAATLQETPFRATTELAKVPFYDDVVMEVYQDDRNIPCLHVKPCCDALGIDYESQRKRIVKDGKMNHLYVEVLTGKTRKCKRRCTMLAVEHVPAWLTTISLSLVHDPGARAKLERFKEEAYKVLADYFLRHKLTLIHEPTVAVPFVVPGTRDPARSYGKRDRTSPAGSCMRKPSATADESQLVVVPSATVPAGEEGNALLATIDAIVRQGNELVAEATSRTMAIVRNVFVHHLALAAEVKTALAVQETRVMSAEVVALCSHQMVQDLLTLTRDAPCRPRISDNDRTRTWSADDRDRAICQAA